MNNLHQNYKAHWLSAYQYLDVLPSHVASSLIPQFPNMQDVQAMEISKTPVGEERGKLWNTPADESFLKQGIIMKPVHTQRIPSYFSRPQWKDWLGRGIGADPQKLKLLSFQFRTHLDDANGIWLHTDANKERALLVLIYLSEELPDIEGNLLLFTPEKLDSTKKEAGYTTYQTGRMLNELNDPNLEFVRTSIVGGQWNMEGKQMDFKLVQRIKPQYNSVVMLDYRQGYNIHAVSPKSSTSKRMVIQQWWSYDDYEGPG